MSRRQKDPLRSLSAEERTELSRLSRSRSASAGPVARATALLAVADGQSYTAAAQRVGRHSGDTVARWVARFNQEGLAAVMPRHGGGSRIRYAEAEQQRILAEVKRMPERARDGNGDVVAEHAAGRLAPSRGRLSRRLHLHDLADAARRRAELAEEPDLVSNRRRHAQMPARRYGHGH